MVKEKDLKLGMVERRKTAPPPDEESWEEGVSSSNLGQTQKSPSLRVSLFLVQSVTVPAGHSSDVKHRPKMFAKFIVEPYFFFLN